MKKGVSILILLIFLFNVGGYYIVFWGLRFHTDKKLIDRLDANLYDEEETVQIKIPLSLPYPIYEQNFQRVNGAFEHNGEHFKLVKHKYENDTLYIVCIRDRETRELVKTMDDYLEMTETAPSENRKAWSFLSKLIKDFYSHEGISIPHQFGLSVPSEVGDRAKFFLKPLLPVHAPPPKL